MVVTIIDSKTCDLFLESTKVQEYTTNVDSCKCREGEQRGESMEESGQGSCLEKEERGVVWGGQIRKLLGEGGEVSS